MNNTVKNVILAILFLVSVILLFVGQKNIGYTGLLLELLGLAGMISTLFLYNKRYQ